VAKAPGRGQGTWDKKNRQFLDKPAGNWYCFSEKRDGPRSRFMGDARPDFGVQTQGTDSGMASEAIEIAQNGLGQRRSAGSESQRESIRRILNKLVEQKRRRRCSKGGAGKRRSWED
jgi:hypothetical protein